MSLVEQPVLLIVGDSITLGAAEADNSAVLRTVDCTYVTRLAALLPGVRIVTDAALHRTTSGARTDLPTLLDRHSADVVLLMLGGNDAELDWKRFVLSDGAVVRQRVTPERYAENLEEMIRTCRVAGAIPVLTDFPRAKAGPRAGYIGRLSGRDVWSMVERHGGEPEWDRRLTSYAATPVTVAAGADVPCVCYADALARCANGGLCDDGVHPDDAGHAAIAAALAAPLSGLCGPATSVAANEGTERRSA